MICSQRRRLSDLPFEQDERGGIVSSGIVSSGIVSSGIVSSVITTTHRHNHAPS